MRRRLPPLLAGAAAVLAAAAPATAATSRASSGACRTVAVPVALEAGAPEEHRVAGRLCGPQRATTLQVLLSGATYASAYWDPPRRRVRHSYVAAMRRSGHAVLNLDRIATGASSRPVPGSRVSFEAHVHVLHQLVGAARDGSLDGRRFRRVVPVGHSLGAAVALVEAARHRDVDGLVLTGFLAHADPVGAPDMLAALRPARLEPRFADRAPDYLTTAPGTRGDLFYHRPGVREDVIAFDEATKDTVTTTELAGVATQPSQPWVDAAIDVPVLSVVGEFDNLFCPASCAAPGSPAYRERDHYPRAPSFETYVQLRAGHVVNLHETASGWFGAARDWLARRVDRR